MAPARTPYRTPKSLSLFPAPIIPYLELMRLPKPGGLYAFYFPYIIGLLHASTLTHYPPTTLLTIAALLFPWTVFLRGAVCTINDVLDADFDRRVARCRNRPVARGAVSPTQGYIWFITQTAVCAAIVTRLPNAAAVAPHAAFIVVALSVYPLAKRVTDFPQVILSVPLTWAIFMACATADLHMSALEKRFFKSTVALAAAVAVWMWVYDTVYAYQDLSDDIKAGVRSMAVRYQDSVQLVAVLGTLQVALLVAAGVDGGLGWPFFVGGVGGNALILVAMAKTVDVQRPETCAWWFLYGGLLVGGSLGLGLGGEYVLRFGEY